MSSWVKSACRSMCWFRGCSRWSIEPFLIDETWFWLIKKQLRRLDDAKRSKKALKKFSKELEESVGRPKTTYTLKSRSVWGTRRIWKASTSSGNPLSKADTYYFLFFYNLSLCFSLSQHISLNVIDCFVLLRPFY